MLEEILKIAMDAGRIVMDYFQKPCLVWENTGGSPVTEADLKANIFISDKLTEMDSDIPIISEESKIPPFEIRKKWTKFWLVDPLDGTKEFIDKLEDFTVNIALIENGEPVLGVIFAPARQELYFAEKGNGSWKINFDGKRSRIFSNDPNKSVSLVVAGSRRHGAAELDEFLKSLKVKSILQIGSSLKFCLVAEGLADIYPRLGPTMEWDVAAGDCIYRNSILTGQRWSPLIYNKEDLRNQNFVIGLSKDIG